MTRRSRALAMLGASAACAGIAASSTRRHEQAVEAQVGSPVPVVVARRDVPQGLMLTPARAGSHLTEQRVPSRFVPPRALRAVREAIGFRAAARMSAGDYVGAAQLRLGPSPKAGAGNSTAVSIGRARLIEVPVSGAESIQGALAPGAVVDVLVTSDRGAGGNASTYVALQRVEVAAFRGGTSVSSDGEGSGADAVATLRVTLRQAVLLTAALNFARELRLVPRRLNDRRRLAPVSVSAADLGS